MAENSETVERSGGCSCGANRYRVRGEAIAVNACYCHACQRLSGSSFTLNMWIEEDRVTVDKQNLRHCLIASGSGQGHIVTFCEICGTYLWGRYLASVRGGLYLKVGTLDDPRDVAPSAQIFTSEKQHWSPLAPEVPNFEGFYGMKDLLSESQLTRVRALVNAQKTAPTSRDTPHPILEFWFGHPTADGTIPKETVKRWFQKSSEFDRECTERFAPELEALKRGEMEEMRRTPNGALAYILIADQMSRNIYRDTPQAFAADDRALAASAELIDTGDINALGLSQMTFAYMPFMHAEDRSVQARSVELFKQLKAQGKDNLDFAQRHRDIVDRFGRFPHRNRILGRASTDEELAFLSQPGSSF